MHSLELKEIYGKQNVKYTLSQDIMIRKQGHKDEVNLPLCDVRLTDTRNKAKTDILVT